MAVNRALSLAVGNRVPSKKVAVGIPSRLTPGSITGAQGNGGNSGSSLQGQQQSKPVVQAIPRAATSVPTPKSRVTAKTPTANSTSRAELMGTANSVAAAACMSGLATAASVPKVEPRRNAVPALVPKIEPLKSSLMNVEPVKTASAACLPHPSAIISATKADTAKTGPVVSLTRPSGIISSPNAAPFKTASAASSPRPASMLSAPKGEPIKSVAAAAAATTTKTTKKQVVGSLSIRNAVNGVPKHVISSSPFNKPSPMAPFSKGPTIQNNSVPSGFASSRLAPTRRVTAATVMPQKPSAGVAATATCKPVAIEKEKTQESEASPFVTTTPQLNKTISTNLVISTRKPVATQVNAPPSLMSKKDQVLQTEGGSCTDKSSLAKPPEKQSFSTVPPLVAAEPEAKPKDEASKGKIPDVATVTGTEQKGL